MEKKSGVTLPRWVLGIIAAVGILLVLLLVVPGGGGVCGRGYGLGACHVCLSSLAGSPPGSFA